MKYFSLLIIIVLFANLTFSQDKSNCDCDNSLWEHVYHPNRFDIYNDCICVTGTIEKLIKEKDGDWHIRLKLDEGLDTLLNKRNYQQQKGCLVLEIICALEVTQKDAVESCEDYINKIYVPKISQHVKVTGTYVLDKQHMWMEIHPVSNIELIK